MIAEEEINKETITVLITDQDPITDQDQVTDQLTAQDLIMGLDQIIGQTTARLIHPQIN